VPIAFFRFLLDPGLPYVVAGVLMLLAAGLIPSQIEIRERRANLEELREQLGHHKHREQAYGLFLDELATGNTTLHQRLIAAQLGLVPARTQPVIISAQLNDTPVRWVERSVSLGSWTPEAKTERSGRSEQAPSYLARLIEGNGRLWLFGAALVSIFIGLLLNPSRPEDESDRASAPTPART